MARAPRSEGDPTSGSPPHCPAGAIVSTHRRYYVSPRTRARDVSIAFPGGEVTVSRTSDGDYWAHICVDRPLDGQTSVVCDGRVDYQRSAPPELSDRPQNLPHVGGVEHVALRIAIEKR